MTPLETYLRELRDIRSSGTAVKETSYYGPLATLLNEIGKTLRPKVRCLITLKNQGAGLPDSGLFTTDQFQRVAEAEPLPGQIPARGAIEAKGTDEDAWSTAASEQVARYLKRYRQVLVRTTTTSSWSATALKGSRSSWKPTVWLTASPPSGLRLPIQPRWLPRRASVSLNISNV